MKVPSAREVLDDPAASYWLKATLDTALSRDPVDAIADAECLVAVLRKEYAPMLEAARRFALSKGPAIALLLLIPLRILEVTL